MDFVSGHWKTIKRLGVEFPRIEREEWRRLRREIGDRAAMECDILVDMTRETWEEECERVQKEDELSEPGDETQAEEDGSQVEEENSQEEEYGW